MRRKQPSRASGQHHGDLKRSLLDTATKLVEAGNVDFSLRELARQAGVTPAAPYHHFVSKTAVLDEVATAGFHALDAALTAAVSAGAQPAAQLAQMVLAYMQFASKHAAHYQLMFPPGLGAGEEHRALLGTAEVAFARLLAAVRKVQPGAPEEDLFFWAFSIWALCHGYLTMHQNGLLKNELPFGSFERLLPRIAALSADFARRAQGEKIG